jgi:hypothetical protein
MSELLKKAWAVINSCESPNQAQIALRYLELLAEAYPEVDVSPLRKELLQLFDMKEFK